jgi:uncharacterized protein YxeA
MKTIIIILIIVILLVTVSFILKYHFNKPKFQGPVPEGYDEEHFRKTGITKPLEN